jgi:hypothetical protein
MVEPILSFLPPELSAHSTPPSVNWFAEDQEKALTEGWYLDEHDGRLTASDEGPFDANDQLALDLIRTKAGAGSEMHMRAMFIENASAALSWLDRLREGET